MMTASPSVARMHHHLFPPLFLPDFMSPSAAGAMLLFAAGGVAASTETSGSVTFEVRCLVTDRENMPLPNIDLRLVLDSGTAVHEGERSTAVRTDPQGKQEVRLPGVLTPGAIKRPTNFVDSLFSRKEPTDELQLGVEWEYLGIRMLYVTTLRRFRSDGTVLHGELAVFTRDERGNFAQAVPRDQNGNWRFPQLGSLVVNDPGFRLAGGLFYPDGDDPLGRRWILKCQLVRSPEPVQK
jgi:hypothetical protein